MLTISRMFKTVSWKTDDKKVHLYSPTSMPFRLRGMRRAPEPAPRITKFPELSHFNSYHTTYSSPQVSPLTLQPLLSRSALNTDPPRTLPRTSFSSGFTEGPPLKIWSTCGLARKARLTSSTDRRGSLRGRSWNGLTVWLVVAWSPGLVSRSAIVSIPQAFRGCSLSYSFGRSFSL